MTRKVFFSFHFKPDSWRAGQVRNIGVVEGNEPVSDNDWESIKRGGDEKIQSWIADQMKGRSCTVVLIGSFTANRKWINHEIIKSWNDNKGVVGIYVHRLKDTNGFQSTKGENPFDYVAFGNGGELSSVVKAYDYISKNLEDWVEEAISINAKYR